MAKEISIELDGQTYWGRMEIRPGGIVAVATLYGQKATQIGGSPAEIVARMLLRELVQAEKARKG